MNTRFGTVGVRDAPRPRGPSSWRARAPGTGRRDGLWLVVAPGLHRAVRPPRWVAVAVSDPERPLLFAPG